MNKLFTKIVGACLGLTMAVGVGVAVAGGSKEAQSVSADTVGNWVQVTATNQIAVGDKIVLVTEYNSTKYYMNNSVNKGHFQAGTFTSSVTDNTNGVITLESTGTANRYKLASRGSTGYVTASKAGSGGGQFSASDSSGWNFSLNGSDWDIVYNSNSAYLRAYQNSFRTYAGRSNTACLIYKYSASHTITFNANGGTGTVPSNITGSGSKTLPSSASLTKTGYTLDGWGDSSHKDAATAQYALGASYTLSADITLYAHWTVNKYSVTASIDNGTFTGATGANAATYGTAYNATISANTDYTLPTSLTVTMGGSAYAGYTYNSSTGAFSIAAPTGNITISGECVPDGGTEYIFSYELSHCSITNAPESMYNNQIKELQIVPDDHYKLPAEDANKVSVTGAVDWHYDEDDGTITINGAEDDLTVTVECVAKAQNTISMGTLTGVSQADGNPTSVEEGASVTLTFTANEGYALPTSTGVTVTGTGSSSTWTQSTGKLQITGGTGNITVSITGITRTVTSITISANSGSYELGDAFVMPTVTAYFNVGASEDVTAKATASGDGLVDGILTKTGSKIITISYGGQSQTYTATVTAATLSSAKYVKITSAPTDWSGTYLIVTDAYSKAMDGTATSNTGACKDITITNSAVTSTATVDTYSFTIAKGTTDNTKYTVKTHSGYYIDRPTSGSGGGLTFSSSTAYELSIVYSTDHVEIRASSYTSNTKQVLQWNNSSSIFKFYTSAQGAIQLYKYQPATVKTLKWISAEVKSGTYYQGSSVSASDFTVTAHYNNGDTSTLSTGVTVTNGYLANIGNNEVTLTYSGKSCKVNVTAVEQTAEYTGLSWTQGEYTIIDGQNIDFSKFGTVTAEYDDGEAYATKAISSCTIATYTKSGDVYTKVADLSDGAKITSSSHGKYLGVTYTETNTYTAYSSAPIYVVEAIEDVFVQEKTYTWTKVSSIAVGDTVILTGTKADGTAPHELSGVTSNSGTIASFSTNPAGTYRLTVVAGASSGSFAFKDADDNYLYHNGTDKTLSLSDELTDASSWTVEFDSDTPTKATVTNVDSGDPLQYNPGNYFRVYASASQQPIQFYKGESSLTPTGDSIANTNVAVQKAVLQFAEHFNDTMDCVNSGATVNVASKWSTLSSDFETAMSGFTGDDLAHFKALFANAYSVEGGDTLQDMLARYDYIVAKYKLSNDFLHDDAGRGAVQYANAVPHITFVNDSNTVAIIVVISMISVTAVGGYFLLRRRKEVK